MLIFVPIVAAVFMVLIAWRSTHSLGRSLVYASIFWGICVAVITETLSLFGWFTRAGVGIGWSLVSISLGLFLAWRPPQYDGIAPRPRLDTSERIALIGAMSIAPLVWLTALFSPPNNWDSMAYHLPRAMNWIDQESVGHFATHFTHNLFQPPWSSFAISHSLLLGESDFFANLVQFVAMLGIFAASWTLLGQLGCGRRARILGSVTAMTLPPVVLEASSTQNDLIVTYWILASMVLGLDDSLSAAPRYLSLGGAMGLAVLSKGTAAVFLLPIVIWLLLRSLRTDGVRVLGYWVVATFVGMALNLGHWLRNIGTFGSPLGLEASETPFANDAFSVGILASNVVRNLALHLTSPVRSINLLLIDGISRLHDVVGLDVSDPATSMMDFDLSSVINNENFAPATLVIVAFPAAVVVLLKRRGSADGLVLQIVALALTMFVLYCAVFRWQLFGARLHLPALVLGALVVGVALDRVSGHVLRTAIITVIIGTGLIFALFNETRPLIATSQSLRSGTIESILTLERDAVRYLTRREAREPYQRIAELARTCDRIATRLEVDGFASPWEYPVWLAKNPDAEIWAFDVQNPSNQFERAPAPACLLVVTPSQGDNLDYAGITYARILHTEVVSAYTPLVEANQAAGTTNRRRPSMAGVESSMNLEATPGIEPG